MDEALKTILAHLKATAAERDRRGGHACTEKQLIKDAGWLTLSIPQNHGGQDWHWPQLYRLVRTLAEADSAVAHVFAFHHLQVATVLLYGSQEQQARLLSATAREHLWWGNAMNPIDPRLTARPTPGGFLLNGAKGFCSGTLGSSLMTLSAIDPASKLLLYGVTKTRQPGITVLDDWDPVGQRQTDSHTVQFEGIALGQEDVLKPFSDLPTPRQTLRTCFAQLVLVNLYLGIAGGAFQEAKQYAQTQARPWVNSQVQEAVDDVHTIRRFAEMHLQLRAATALADQAADALEAAFLRGDAVTPDERGDVAVAIAEAKVLAHRASLSVSSELFEVAGARGAKASLGFDRYWRNARTHTLHDPLDYKLAMLGRWALQDKRPAVDLYN